VTTIHRLTPWWEPIRSHIHALHLSTTSEGIAIACCDSLGRVASFSSGYIGSPEFIHQPIINEHTKFQLASISKFITACLVLELSLRGKLKLDEQIQPPHNILNVPVTLGQLLTHRAGFIDTAGTLGTIDGSRPFWTTEYWQNNKSHLHQTETVGEYHYSTWGYWLIQKIIEWRFEIPFEQLLQRWLCFPLGLTATTSSSPKTTDSTACWGHDSLGKPLAYGWRHFQGIEAAAGVWSSAADMGLLISHLLQPKFTNSKGAKLLVRLSDLIAVPSCYGYQYGLLLTSINREKVLLHTGTNPGYHAVLQFCPKSKTGFVVMTNLECLNIFNQSLVKYMEWLMVDTAGLAL